MDKIKDLKVRQRYGDLMRTKQALLVARAKLKAAGVELQQKEHTAKMDPCIALAIEGLDRRVTNCEVAIKRIESIGR